MFFRPYAHATSSRVCNIMLMQPYLAFAMLLCLLRLLVAHAYLTVLSCLQCCCDIMLVQRHVQPARSGVISILVGSHALHTCLSHRRPFRWFRYALSTLLCLIRYNNNMLKQQLRNTTYNKDERPADTRTCSINDCNDNQNFTARATTSAAASEMNARTTVCNNICKTYSNNDRMLIVSSFLAMLLRRYCDVMRQPFCSCSSVIFKTCSGNEISKQHHKTIQASNNTKYNACFVPKG